MAPSPYKGESWGGVSSSINVDKYIMGLNSKVSPHFLILMSKS